MNCGGYFDYHSKKEIISKLESEMLDENFWDNKRNAEKKINELNYLKNLVEEISNIKNIIENNIDILNMCNDNDEDIMLVSF